ncbi:MAG: hypothetical protein JOZ29_14000 [Deltaproteobacteria bacterium]|nr:hypothetical protein [Deltaproteobacteria bacterium]
MRADTLLFDKLTYVDRLTKAGINEARARDYAKAMEEALRESVATKSDIAELRHEIQLAVRDMTIRVGGMLMVGCSWWDAHGVVHGTGCGAVLRSLTLPSEFEQWHMARDGMTSPLICSLSFSALRRF